MDPLDLLATGSGRRRRGLPPTTEPSLDRIVRSWADDGGDGAGLGLAGTLPSPALQGLEPAARSLVPLASRRHNASRVL